MKDVFPDMLDPVRRIDSIDIKRWQNFIVLEVQATAFLYHMVRNIVGVLLAVASGEKSKSEALGLGDNEFVPWQVGATM